MVECLIDVLVVDVLDLLEERSGELDVAGFFHDLDEFREVEFGLDGPEQVIEGFRLFFEVEEDGLVVEVGVGDLLEETDHDLVRESCRRVLDHDVDGVVGLVVVSVHVDSLAPEAHLLASPQHLQHVHLLEVLPAVLHDFLWLVVCVQHSQLCEDAHMSPLHSKCILQQLDHLLLGIVLLVLLDQAFQQVRHDDDILSRDRGVFELRCLHAREAQFLPCFRGVRLLGRLDGLAELLKSDEARGDLGVVVERHE